MPEHDHNDDQLEDRLRRAFQWMAEGAEKTEDRQDLTRGGHAATSVMPDSKREESLYLDEPLSRALRRATSRKVLLAVAAVIILPAIGIPIGLVATGHGDSVQGGTGGSEATAKTQIISALAATTSANNWDISYTYGEVPGSTPASTSTSTSTPTSANCLPALVVACAGSANATSAPHNVTVTGDGIIDVNPKAMVTTADISNFGSVVLRLDATNVWEFLSGDGGGLAPNSRGTLNTGQSLASYASPVESTLGTREGAVAMLGIASPTGYLELNEQAIIGVIAAGLGTVNGKAVTKYTVSVQPTQLASDAAATSGQVDAIKASLATLNSAGMTRTTDEVAVDAQGYIVQSVSTYRFADGGSVTVEAAFSNFGCAGTVLMPGQTGATNPPTGCISPDSTPLTPTTSTAPTTSSPTTVPTTTVPSPANPAPTTTPPHGANSTTSTSAPLPAGVTISVAVPNVVGLSPAQASAALSQAGLEVQFDDNQSGSAVVSQSPSAGSRVEERSVVVLRTT